VNSIIFSQEGRSQGAIPCHLLFLKPLTRQLARTVTEKTSKGPKSQKPPGSQVDPIVRRFLSNGKKFGTSGKKIGNAHLRRAFSLAAQLFLKSNMPGRQLYSKLTGKHGKGKDPV